MFFRNFYIALFLKFFWWGLVFGLLGILFLSIVKLWHKNVYASNLVSFCFILAMGVVHNRLCMLYYNYSFCWFGLLGMLLGYLLVKISVEFFFTILAKLLYNKFIRAKDKEAGYAKSKHGKLRAVQGREKT